MVEKLVPMTKILEKENELKIKITPREDMEILKEYSLCFKMNVV